MNTKALKHNLSVTTSLYFDQLTGQIESLGDLGGLCDNEKTTRRMMVNYCQQINNMGRNMIRTILSLMQEVEGIEAVAAEPDFEMEDKDGKAKG